MIWASPFVVLFLCVLRTTASAADFHLAPHGSDLNPGTEARPFATLERARDAVREQKRHQPNRDYEVAIRGGIYRFSHTLVFSLEDSAASGHTITYAAYRDEK